MKQTETNVTNNTTTMEGVQKMKQNTRLIEAMHWQSLKERYFIGTMQINGKAEHINQLADAIEAGDLDKLVAECAEKYHAGNVYQAYVAWSKTLSSMRTNMKMKAYSKAEWTRYHMLRSFVTDRMAALKGSGREGNSKAYWQWSLEEIEAIPADDLRTIKSVYDNMASKKSKYPDLVEDMPDFAGRFAAVAAKYAAAKKLARQDKESPVEVDAALLAKLSKGGTAVLSRAEAAQLAELLQKLSK